MPSHIIHRHLGNDGIIEISQENNIRSLHFGNDAKQSSMDVFQPSRLVLTYTQAMMAGLLFCPHPKSVLLIGLGGGSLVKFLLQHFPRCDIDAVEYREEVVDLAYRYFCLPEDRRLRVFIDDGLNFVTEGRGRFVCYDLILIDAFDHAGVSESVKMPSFFSDCHERLKRQGVLVVNLWNSNRDRFKESITLLETAFQSNILLLPIKHKENVVAYALKEAHPPLKSKHLKSVAEQLEGFLELGFKEYIRQLRRNN